jgi:mRNA-degrading endonuclease RelE of RelBE toxin-antitoxin system
MPKGGRKSVKGKPEAKAPLATSAPYEVDMSASAEAVYVDLYKRTHKAEAGGDPTNAICTKFRMVEEAIERIIPRDPMNRRYALRDDFSNIYRLQKGRLRICWIASSKLRRVCILFISETQRKEGDVNDPYRMFAKLLMSGELDEHFQKMGVKKSLQSRLIQ